MHEVQGRRRVTGVLALLVAMMAWLAMTQVAEAGVISKSGSTYTYTSNVTGAASTVEMFFCPNGTGGCISDFWGKVGLSDSAETITADASAPGCTESAGIFMCPADGITNFTVLLGDGNDTLRPNSRHDTGGSLGPFPIKLNVSGQDGNDTITGAQQGDTINGNAGNDTLSGGLGGADTINGGTGNDAIFGGSGNDVLRGNEGDDAISGGDGNDEVTGNAGADKLKGDAGTDVTSYAGRTIPVTVDLTSTGQTNGSIEDQSGTLRDSVAGIENVIGGSGDDVLLGDGLANQLEGAAGDDTITGRGGADKLIGGSGRDTVSYAERTGSQPVNVSLDGAPNDGAPGENDDIGTTFEIVVGGAGNDTLTSGGGVGGTPELRGGPGNDTIRMASNGGFGFGNEGNDTLIGGTGVDRLEGGLGDDSINGGGGADILRGGENADTIEARDGVADNVDCGPDLDTAFTDASDTRTNCELPAPPPPPPPPPGGGGTGGNGGGGTPQLKLFDVTISYAFFPLNPKKTTRFEGFIAKDVPKGTRITVRCVKAKNGKKCRGKLGASMTIKKTKKKTNKLKVLNRKYPAGSNLEVTFSKTGYRTKIKILKVLKNRRPVVNTKCIDPGSTKRKSC